MCFVHECGFTSTVHKCWERVGKQTVINEAKIPSCIAMMLLLM